MREEHWQSLTGTRISEYVVAGTFQVSEHRAAFRLSAPAEHVNAGSCLLLCEVPDQKTCEAERNRFLEAMFLEHPNLIRIYDSGCLCDGGRWLHFAVTERLDEALADVSASVPTPEWALPVASALTYLHENRLVHCALSSAAIWRAAGTWKLGDFSELRAEGTYSPQDTRRLMIRPELSVPPEAWEGVVSPAWDVWSLGSMLRIAGCEDRAVADMLEPSPAERVSVARLLAGNSTAALTPESSDAVSHSPEPAAPPTRPEPTETVSVPQLIEAPTISPRARAVHAKAAGFTRASRRIVVWTSVALAFAALLLLAAAMSGQRGPVAQPSSQHIANPSARQVQPQQLVPQPAVAERTPADPRRQIDSLLTRWAESTRARDVDGLVACYAPAVTQFFGGHNLRTADLIRAKQEAFNTVGPIRTFNVSAISFDRLTANSAVVSFRKQWDFPARHFSGTERDQMELRRIGDEWKIVSEREIGQRKTEMRD